MGLVGSCNAVFSMVSQTIKMDLRKLVIDLLKVIYILLLVYLGYQIIIAIMGGSWATENIIIAGMGIILAGMFVIVGFLINQSKSLGKLEERTRNIGESLSSLGKDFKEHLKRK